MKHAEDTDHYWTGSEGRWTVCGLPWTNSRGDDDCPQCVSLWQVRLRVEAKRQQALRIVSD